MRRKSRPLSPARLGRLGLTSTIIALEKSGKRLARVEAVFSALTRLQHQ